jgi:hypothetical protein
VLAAMIAGAVWAAGGCDSPPPVEKTGPTAAEHEAALRFQAVQPLNMAHEVSRRPVFAWKLPEAMQRPQFLTFKLFEVGPTLPEGAKPDENFEASPGETELAVVSGLASSGTTGLDLFAPPAGSITTGPLSDKKNVQLKPNTWYHWKVHAVDSGSGRLGSFYFMTRSEPATVALPPEPEVKLTLPPMPEPRPPEPIDSSGSTPKAPKS